MKSAGPLIFLAVAAFLMWAVMIRPARRRQLELQGLQTSVEVGSEVMLGSGIYGTVISVDDQTIALEIAPGTTVKVARAAVVRIVDDEPTAPEESTDPAASPTMTPVDITAESPTGTPADGQ